MRTNDWVTKHNIYIIDKQLNRVGGILSLPIAWLIYKHINGKFSAVREYIIMISIILALSMVFAQLIGMWVSKKPPSSNWRNY